jgi:putative transposase
MPRRPRLVVRKIPLHIIQRGNNRQACFFSDDDYLFYLECLQEYSQKTNCMIHGYVLMTKHVHLLLTPRDSESVGQLMKRLGQRYVQYVNRTYQRRGTLWEGRYRSCIAQEDNYLLQCLRYIELNPVRAEMVLHPADYRWSSYRTNAEGERNKLINPHFMYEKLGLTDTARQENYRELFRYSLEPGMVDEIRKATNGNFVLGNDRFKEEISKVLGRRVQPGKAGRPVKNEK